MMAARDRFGTLTLIREDESVLLHSREPQILESVSEDHPLYGRDLRTVPDVHLAEGAARAIFPGFERIHARLGVIPSGAVGSVVHEEVRDLSSSALRRVSRILIQRARIETTLPGAGPPSIEVSDEVLDAVTLAYVHMAGVFDALAIVNGLLAGLTNYRDMGWQKRQFRRDVRRHAPLAVELMAPEGAGGEVLGAVLSFRNTIHKRMPDPVEIGHAGGDPQLREMRLHLERRSHGDIFTAFQDAGWTKYVGVQLAGDHLFVRPESLTGCMLNDGVPVLNQLSDATPVEDAGGQPLSLNPERSLYPPQLRAYAIEYLGLRQLVA